MASVFIIYVQQDIRDDFTETTAKLIRVLIQNATATPFGEYVDPPPLDRKLLDNGYVGVQYTMYASLAVSVLAACIATSGSSG